MGTWQVLDLGHEGTQVLAIHAALMPDGRLVYFAGSEHDEGEHNRGEIDHSRIWDPVTNTIVKIPSPPFDLFCCGHAYLGDGRLLVAGGTKTYDFLGMESTRVLDTHAGAGDPWIDGPDMVGLRWYPTLVTLPDGRVLIVAGALTDCEVFTAQHNDFNLTHVGQQPEIPGLYPRLHLLPDSRILCVTPMAGVSRAWNPWTGAWADVSAGPGPEYVDFQTSSVLLPLHPEDGYRARVMVTGAAQPKILDLAAAGHGWQPTSGRALHGSPVRNHSCAVLLPDATVVVVGGTTTFKDADGVRDAEIYDPATDTWSVDAQAAVPRVYHSVALLLPDGRVWTAGSNHDGARGTNELRTEVFSPSYLSGGPRPQVHAAPDEVHVPIGWPTAGTIEIDTPQAATVDSVALLRCGSVTHAFDADQRYVGLAIVGRDAAAGRLTVQLPPTAEVAPPGPYLLFVLDHNGVPSLGRPLHVGPLAWSAPQAIPGWFGDETADGDVALADINGSGRPDLIVAHVDAPGGENRGWYRVGRDLNLAGIVAGGWIDPRPVPGWFGDETQGTGVAVGDISATGRPDIVFFHVDAPGGENQGWYRIGWDLNAEGEPIGGWTEVKQVPGWFGAETAGAGVALADLSGSGQPDLVVFHIDNPGGENQGYYRIGWDLDDNGDPAGGWTGFKAVPGWFGAETAGAGVAAVTAASHGGGHGGGHGGEGGGAVVHDLVVFFLDAPEGENRGYYRIGRALDANGDVTGGWSDAIGIPGWFGDVSQGAGIAVAPIGGSHQPDVVVFHIDAPAGANAGHYRSLVV